MGAYTVLCYMDSTGVWVHILHGVIVSSGPPSVVVMLQYGPGALCLVMYIQVGYGCIFSTGCLCVLELSGKPFVVLVSLKKAVENKMANSQWQLDPAQ